MDITVNSFIDLAFKSFRSHFANMSAETVYLYYGSTVGMIAVLMVFEMFFLGWENSSLKRLTVKPSRSARLDIGLCLLYAANLTPFLMIILSFGLAAIIPLSVKKYFGYDLIHAIPYVWLQVLVYVVIYDFLAYWKHRLAHEIPWWWQVHETHHSARELNMITSNRIHPLDEAYSKIFTCLPLAIAGIPPEWYLVIRTLHFGQFLLIHSELPWAWGWIGKYVFVPPSDHRIHHSDLPEHRNRNYGNFTPFWDRLFGTRYLGSNLRMVVQDRPYYNHGAWYAEVWSAYIRSLTQLADWTRARIKRTFGAAVPSSKAQTR